MIRRRMMMQKKGRPEPYWEWDLTDSYVDKKKGKEATPYGTVTRNSNGAEISTSSGSALVFASVSISTHKKLTIEADFTIAMTASGGSGNRGVLLLTNNTSIQKMWGVVYRITNGYWAIKDSLDAFKNLSSVTDRTIFNGHTMKVQIDYADSQKCYIYCDDTFVGELPLPASPPTSTRYISTGLQTGQKIKALRVWLDKLV